MWNAEKGRDEEDEGAGNGMMKVLSGKRARFARPCILPGCPNTFASKSEGQRLRNSVPRNAGRTTSPLPGPLADEIRKPFREDFFLMLENLPSKQHSSK
jgi:hypothetical protein